MTWSNRVTTATQDYLAPKAVDTILASNVFARDMLMNAGQWRGETYKQPIKVTSSSQGKSFSGLDTFTTTVENNFINLSYLPKFFEQPVVVSLTEVDVNATEKVIDIMAREMESASMDAADAIGTMFYADGTGNSSKDFLGLEAIVDDTTNVATIGGQARATYSTLNATVTASGGTLSLDKMATLYNTISDGALQPNKIYTTKAIAALYEKLVQPMMRINTTGGTVSTGTAGFKALDYKGIAVVPDSKCTSGVLYMLNTDFITWKALKSSQYEPVKMPSSTMEGSPESPVSGLGFHWSGWIKPINQYALVGHLILAGDLITKDPGRSGKLTGISGV